MKDSEKAIMLTCISYSEPFIKLLADHKIFHLVSVITKKGVLSADTLAYISENSIHLYEMEDDKIREIEKHILTEKVLIYKFGYIIPSDIIAQHDFCNIHPGSIETNRGAHPLRWTILLGEKTTYMTLYQITGIDEGNVICEKEIAVENSDYVDLDHKMDAELPHVLDAYVNYVLHGASVRIMLKEGGIYRPKVQEKDYTLDIDHDTFEVMERKIRAVKDFGGAVMMCNQTKYRVKAIVRRGDGYVLICEEFRWR